MQCGECRTQSGADGALRMEEGWTIVDKTKQFEKSPESEVWNAISAFEQILEAIPEDRTALETLYDAYDHIGDKSRSLEYVIQLSEVIIAEGDSEPLGWLYSEIERIGGEDSRVEAAHRRIETTLQEMGLPSPADMAPAKRKAGAKVNISSELSLAWNLMQAALLNQDEYSIVVEDLTENSTKPLNVPVTVQHVLNDRDMTNQDRVIEFLCQDSTLPLITLADFEIESSSYTLLTMNFLEHRGAIVFDMIGNEALVAILNPYNYELRDDIQAHLKRNCHFYLVNAEDYDLKLNKIRDDRRARIT